MLQELKTKLNTKEIFTDAAVFILGGLLGLIFSIETTQAAEYTELNFAESGNTNTGGGCHESRDDNGVWGIWTHGDYALKRIEVYMWSDNGNCALTNAKFRTVLNGSLKNSDTKSTLNLTTAPTLVEWDFTDAADISTMTRLGTSGYVSSDSETCGGSEHIRFSSSSSNLYGGTDVHEQCGGTSYDIAVNVITDDGVTAEYPTLDDVEWSPSSPNDTESITVSADFTAGSEIDVVDLVEIWDDSASVKLGECEYALPAGSNGGTCTMTARMFGVGDHNIRAVAYSGDLADDKTETMTVAKWSPTTPISNDGIGVWPSSIALGTTGGSAEGFTEAIEDYWTTRPTCDMWCGVDFSCEDEGEEDDGITCVMSWVKWAIVPPTEGMTTSINAAWETLRTRWPLAYVIDPIYTSWQAMTDGDGICPLPTAKEVAISGVGTLPEVDACDWMAAATAKMNGNSDFQTWGARAIYLGAIFTLYALAKSFLLPAEKSKRSRQVGRYHFPK